MKDLRKNKQGEPAIPQPKGANELSDDVLEAATGGVMLQFLDPREQRMYDFHAKGRLIMSTEELERLERRFGPVGAMRTGLDSFMIGSDDTTKLQIYFDFLTNPDSRYY